MSPKLEVNTNLDFKIDPAPDLAIEIYITSSPVKKFNVYSALNVADIWRYDAEILRFYQLVENE
jgi:Uma2 family endonuclease